VKNPLEDALAHVPPTSILECRRGQAIYSPEQPSTSIYLVIDGKVKVSRLAGDGSEVVVDIYQPDDFFGESAFLNLSRCQEHAVALENTRLMSWISADIEDIIMRRPLLAVALVQIFVQRGADFSRRIESFAVDNIPRRLARSLIHLAERLGSAQEDGSIRMPAFTHELISQYVGTTRETVTYYMNQFRKRGYIRYSRKGIILYSDSFQQWLQESN
jgi:CRP/FNR family transcriptional regulator, cyclic AMP receptor protein